MIRISFNADWIVRPKVSSFSDIMAGRNAGTAVTLPHDAMITFGRSPTGGEGPSTAFFPGGVVEYSKTLDVPVEWRRRRVWIEFQGVYRDAMVFVNGAYATQRPNGYVPFRVPLDAFLQYGETNTIRVEARATRTRAGTPGSASTGTACWSSRVWRTSRRTACGLPRRMSTTSAPSSRSRPRCRTRTPRPARSHCERSCGIPTAR